MHSLRNTRLMPYSAEFIKDIIMNIESYPLFLPWCSSAAILSKNDSFVTAKLDIVFKGFSESYISKVIQEEDKDKYTIIVEAISGPFEFLKNIWTIDKNNDMSKVYFSIDFQLKSKILDIMIGIVFSSAAEKMIAAFENRAKELTKQIV